MGSISWRNSAPTWEADCGGEILRFAQDGAPCGRFHTNRGLMKYTVHNPAPRARMVELTLRNGLPIAKPGASCDRCGRRLANNGRHAVLEMHRVHVACLDAIVREAASRNGLNSLELIDA